MKNERSEFLNGELYNNLITTLRKVGEENLIVKKKILFADCVGNFEAADITSMSIIDLLPVKFRELVDFHDAIDKIYCFVVKRKLTCTISRIERLYNEQLNGSFCVNMLLTLCAACPDGIRLRYENQNESEMKSSSKIELEVIFPLHAAPSPGQSSKRRKHFIEALFKHVTSYFRSQFSCEKLAAFDKSLKLVKTKGWPADFAAASCPIPEGDVSLRAMIENYMQSKSFGAPQATVPSHLDCFGLDSRSDSSSAAEGSCSSTAAVDIQEGGGAAAVLDYLRAQPFYKDQIKHVERVAARQAVYADLAPPALPSLLVQRVQVALGLSHQQELRLYLHQARAIDALRAGKHAVVSTSTASGKSIIYNIPVIEAAMQFPESTSLYLFPTKVSGIQATK